MLWDDSKALPVNVYSSVIHQGWKVLKLAVACKDHLHRMHFTAGPGAVEHIHAYVKL